MLTFQIDYFAECIPEIKKIIATHHDELGLFRDLMPLDPDWREYVHREAANELFLTTGRWNGNIVAYYIAHVRPGFHYRSTLTGTMDIAYVVPQYRNKGLAVPLFRHTERELRRRGVKVWYSGCKLHNDLGMPRLHEALGFAPADLYFVKWLGVKNAAPR